MARIPAMATTGAARGRSRVGSGGNLINFYVEQSPEGARNGAWLNGAPGLTLFSTIGTSAVRGVYAFKGFLYAITGEGLYRVNGAGTATLVSAFTVSSRVDIADNGLVMVFVDGSRGWAFDGTTVREITENGFYPSDNVRFLDQYFIFNRSGTGQFFWSETLAQFTGSSLDPLDFATAEAAPDNTVGVDVLNQQIWLYGDESVEVWYSSGDEATFTRVPGAVIDRGCVSAQAHIKAGNRVFWLSPQGVVYQNQGYQEQRVSTHAVEFDITGRDFSQVQMWTYEQEGHIFVMMTFPDRTWCFDVVTGEWHIRRNIDKGRHRASNHAFIYGKHLVGDAFTGLIYELSLSTHTDNGRPLVSEVWYAPQHNNRGNIFWHSFEVDGDWGWNDKIVETSAVSLPSVNDELYTIDGGVLPSSGNVASFTAATATKTFGAINGAPFYRTNLYGFGSNVIALQGTTGDRDIVGFYIDLEEEGYDASVYNMTFNLTPSGGDVAGIVSQTYSRIRIYQANEAGSGESTDVTYISKGMPPSVSTIESVYDSGDLLIGTNYTPVATISKRYISVIWEGWSTTGASGNALEMFNFDPTVTRDAVSEAASIEIIQPKASIDWSNDGGSTWSNERILGVGRVGQRWYRLKTERLGSARDRVYRLRMDGEHPRRISTAAYMEATPEP